MRVAVTGASGFVGGFVARALAAEGHEVTCYGRRSAAMLRAPLPGYRAWDVTAAMAVVSPTDVVVHCAARVGDWGAERDYVATNVEGTRAVLAAFPGARMVYVSTSSVYSDEVDKSLVREDALTGACRHSAYARTKAAAERLVLDGARSGVVLRPHIVYGPGDTTLLPRLLAARRAGTLLIPGDGRRMVSVTHVENLARAVSLAISPGAPPGAYNVADAEPLAVDALLRTVLARTGTRARIRYLGTRRARALAAVLEGAWRVGGAASAPPLTRYVVDQLTADHVLDTTRIRTLLGYVPRWGVHDGPLA